MNLVYTKLPWDRLLCSEMTGVWFIQVKLIKISFIGTLFIVSVWFIQWSVKIGFTVYSYKNYHMAFPIIKFNISPQNSISSQDLAWGMIFVEIWSRIWYWNSYLVLFYNFIIKMKNKKHHSVGTVPKYDRKNKNHHSVGTVPKYNRKTRTTTLSEQFQNLIEKTRTTTLSEQFQNMIEKQETPLCRNSSKIW